MYNFSDEETNLLQIYIKSPALIGLIAPIIEDYTKEVGGILIGEVKKVWINGNKEYAIVIENSTPSLTAKRTPNAWIPTNKEAQSRLTAVVKSLSLSLLGGYHSHPNSFPALSLDDKDFVSNIKNDQTFSFNGNVCTWVELVIKISKKELDEVQDENSTWKGTKGSTGKKIAGKITIGKDYGFNVTIAGYVYIPNGKPKINEVTVWLENSSSFEKENKLN